MEPARRQNKPAFASRSPGTQNCFFNLAQAILAEEDFIADKQSRSADGAAPHRIAH
jgi:hypothetical protein